MENLIEATILTGPYEGEAVLIPRIPMIPTDLLFQFKRLQFPIRLLRVVWMHVCLFVKRAFAYDVIISTYGFVYAQTMGKPRMLFIRNFYVV